MRIKIAIICLVLLICPCVFGAAAGSETSSADTAEQVLPLTDAQLAAQQTIQKEINAAGVKILNANKIDKRVIFVYNESEKKSLLSAKNNLTKRQVVLYGCDYKFIENADEMAAFVAREIAVAVRSYDGLVNGALSSVQMTAAPKKYELVADKIAVDYMVKAGYHPAGLITFINKSCPQRRFERFARSNLASTRLAAVYEYICAKYPYYLENNPYSKTDAWQNFLLNSGGEREQLEKKPADKPSAHLKYNYESYVKVPIELSVTENINSEQEIIEGQQVVFKVCRDVRYRNKTVVSAGELVPARVETIITSGMNGIPASFILGDFKFANVPAGKISDTYEVRGHDRSLWVFPLKWALTPIPPTGSATNFIKGGHAKLKTADTIRIYYHPGWI